MNDNLGVCSSSSGGGGSALHVGVCKHTVRGFETRVVYVPSSVFLSCIDSTSKSRLLSKTYLAAEAAVRGKVNGH